MPILRHKYKGDYLIKSNPPNFLIKYQLIVRFTRIFL